MSKNELRRAFSTFRSGDPHRVSPSAVVRHSFTEDGNTYHAYEAFEGRGKRRNGRTMLRVTTLKSFSQSSISAAALASLIEFTTMHPNRKRALTVREIEPNRFSLTLKTTIDGHRYTYGERKQMRVGLWDMDKVTQTLTDFSGHEQAALDGNIASAADALVAKHNSH